jgi:hypothetical protein
MMLRAGAVIDLSFVSSLLFVLIVRHTDGASTGHGRTGWFNIICLNF